MKTTTPAIRQKCAAPFTQVPNELLNDSRLSGKAKGILCYLLSKPPGWKVRIKDIVNHFSDGERAVRAGLSELRVTGYAVLETCFEGDSINGQTFRFSAYPEFADRIENERYRAEVGSADFDGKINVSSNCQNSSLPKQQSAKTAACQNAKHSNTVGVERRMVRDNVTRFARPVIPQFSAEGEKIDSITTTTNKPSRQGRETVGGSSSSEASPFAPSAVGSLTAPQDTGSKNLEEQEEQEVPDDLQDYTSEVNRSMVDELKSKWEETYRIAFKRSPRFTAADEKAFSELIRYFGDMGVRQIIAVMIYAWGAQHTEYEETGFMEHFYCNKFSQKPADLIRTGKNGVMYFEKMMTELNWRGKSDKIEKAHAAIEACKKREQKRS